MKKMFLFLIFGLMITFTACQSNRPSQTTMNEQEKQKVVAIGDSAATRLLKNLKNALMEAIQQGGPVNALSVCNTKALPLTEDIAHQFGKSIDIKRTTRKYRNPKNAPDSLEQEALAYFEKNLQSGKLPPYYIQKVKTPAGIEYRYYKPLKVAPLCLNCHGDENMLSPQVAGKLKELYPGDKATGYKDGDFRGVIRVKLGEDVLNQG